MYKKAKLNILIFIEPVLGNREKSSIKFPDRNRKHQNQFARMPLPGLLHFIRPP
jgi:hypothetical protein